jgi:hypothetical protein
MSQSTQVTTRKSRRKSPKKAHLQKRTTLVLAAEEIADYIP